MGEGQRRCGVDKAIIAELILGTYEHDLFKPFWLGNFQHALLGYAWQRAAGRSEARCAAVLLHSVRHFSANLARHLAWWTEEPHTLPKALLLAPAMDWIASASYGLYVEERGEDGAGGDAEAGAEPVQIEADGDPLHKQFEGWPLSIQNPFSRLPMWNET